MKKSKISYNRITITFILMIILLVGCLFSTNVINYAKAETTAYTNVLDDLKKSSNFNESDYTYNKDDYSIKLITLAESSSQELFAYIYSPRIDTIATYITMSNNDDFTNANSYKLEVLSISGVFCKYKVKDYNVTSDTTRIYYVSQIMRKFIQGVDTAPSSSTQTINYVEFKVGKSFTFTTANNTTTLVVNDIELITITDKFVGFVRYTTGYLFLPNRYCDSHFIAFNTDKQIDKLLEVDVYYKTQSYHYDNYGYTDEYTYGEPESQNVTLLSDDKTGWTGGGLSGSQYNWSRIQDCQGFFDSIDETPTYSMSSFNSYSESSMNSDIKNELLKCKWFLRFADTSYSYSEHYSNAAGYDLININKTIVSDVQILRLKFETEGHPYNLLTIDNMQTGSTEPIKTVGGGSDSGCQSSSCSDFFNTLKIIFFVLIAIILTVLIIKLVKKIKNSDFVKKKKKDLSNNKDTSNDVINIYIDNKKRKTIKKLKKKNHKKRSKKK